MNFRLDPECEEVVPRRSFNAPEFSPTFTREDFAREYDAACHIILSELSRVGSVALAIGSGDFSLAIYEDERCVGFVANHPDAPSPVYVPAAHAALQLLQTEYTIVFDADPAYIAVRRDGTVYGYCWDGSPEPFAAFGFPTDTA